MAPPPPWAVLCWTDDINIYIELPCTDGTFYRESFPLYDWAKALNILRNHKPKGPAEPTHLHPSYRDEQRAFSLRKLAALGLT